MTENDIKRIVAETLAKVSSEIHSTTTTTQTSTPSQKKNGNALRSWMIPLIASVVIAVVGWVLYIGEKTSDTAHSELRTSIQTESAARTVEDAALVKQLDLFTTLASEMRDDIATLKAQMTILMGRMK